MHDEDRHADLIGYEFPVHRVMDDAGTTRTVRVVGSWPCNGSYVLCEVLGTESESLIRPANIVRTRKLMEATPL